MQSIALLIIGFVAGVAAYAAWLRYRGRPPHSSLDDLLRASEPLLSAIPQAVIILNQDMTIAAWNQAAEELYGFRRDEVLGKSVSVVLAALPGTMQPEVPRLVLRTGQPWHGRFTTRNKAGAILPIGSSSAVIRRENGEVIGYIGVDRSIAEQIQFEEQFVYQATLLSAVQDAMIAVDTHLNITEWNRAAELMYGYLASEAMGHPIADLLRTENLSEVGAAYSTQTRRSGIWQGRLIHHRKTGERVIVSTAVSMLYSDLGLPIGYLSVDRDITAQVEIEKALEKQNLFLETLNRIALALLDRLDVDSLLADLLNRACALVGANDACAYLLDRQSGRGTMTLRVGLGASRDRAGRQVVPGKGITGKVLEKLEPVNIPDYPSWPDRSDDLEMVGAHAVVALPLRSGERVLGIVCMMRDADRDPFPRADVQILSRVAELASIALDNAQLFQDAQQEIAERRRAEQELTRLNAELESRVAERAMELESQRAQLSAIVDAMGEGVVYSENGKIRYINRAITHLTGYTIGELLDQPRTVLLSTPQALHQQVEQRGARPRQTWRGQSIVHRHDGSHFEAALTLTHLDAADPNVQNADVLIVRDITEERQLDEQKAKFIANASHELRTPLTNLKTRLYLLHRQPERHNEHIAVIERVTGRMAQLVDDLLDVTRFERGAIRLFRQNVSLQPLVQEVVELQRPEALRKHISLQTALQPAPIIVYADSDRLTQVIVNILINAINYTSEGGAIHITLSQADGEAVLAVRDTGIGIAAENLQRIFEPFFRASEGTARGTGLGLNIAQEIIRLHGGTIAVESELGAGSKFSVCLPLAAQP